MPDTVRRGAGEKTRRMVTAAMLSAITIVLVFTPIGMIPLPPPLPAATTVHVPVLIAAVVEGPLVGAAVGLVFGVCSLIRAWQTGMVGLTLFFRNPLVSVMPRVLFALLAALLYMFIKKLLGENAVKDKIAAMLAAIVGTLLNTVGCLGMILLLYGNELNELISNMISIGSAEPVYAQNAAGWLVAVVGLPNGLAEALVAAALVPIIKTAADAVKKRSKRR